MGILSGAWFYLTESNLLHPPHGRTLWDVLDSRVAAELASACEFLHEPRDRYSDNSPILAAMRLGSDFRHVDYLTTHEPEDSIVALARARRVAVRHIATYDLIPSGEELLKLPPAVNVIVPPPLVKIDACAVSGAAVLLLECMTNPPTVPPSSAATSATGKILFDVMVSVSSEFRNDL